MERGTVEWWNTGIEINDPVSSFQLGMCTIAIDVGMDARLHAS